MALSLDCLRRVFEFLAHIDVVATWHANPRWFSKKQGRRHARHCVEKALRGIGIKDASAFCAAMRHHGAVLTGSFLLWCLTEDASWCPRDIDIATCWRANDPFMFYLFENFGTRVDSAEGEEIRWNPSAMSEDPQVKFEEERTFFVQCRRDNPVAKVTMKQGQSMFMCHTQRSQVKNRQYPQGLPVISRTFTFDGVVLPVNHLQVYGVANIRDYIERFFDVNFCKLGFDGERLHVSAWVDLWRKKSVVSWPEYLQIHSHFFNGPHPPHEEFFHYDTNTARQSWFYFRLTDRQQRYRTRGYDIELANVDERVPKFARMTMGSIYAAHDEL